VVDVTNPGVDAIVLVTIIMFIKEKGGEGRGEGGGGWPRLPNPQPKVES
jgi:hypothetical protein